MQFIEYLEEKLMIFGKSAYPKFGHVVIISGGAGSGKGFTTNKLMGIEGKVFDVDELKRLAIKAPMFAKKVKDETAHDIASFDLHNPDNVSKMHEIIGTLYNLPKKNQQTMFANILTLPPEKKPNLIFDVTLRDISKLESITRNVVELGYDKKNIHVVWVVNDVSVARTQNLSRKRVVADEILLDTHIGASLTMKRLLDMGASLQKYLDGAIFLSFNKVGIDTDLIKSKTGGSYVSASNYFKVKEVGKLQKSSKDLSKDIYDKIVQYVPKVDIW